MIKRMVRLALCPVPSKKMILGGLVSCSIILIYYYYTWTPTYQYPVYGESTRRCNNPMYYAKNTLKSTPSSYSQHLAIVQLIQTVVEDPLTRHARQHSHVWNEKDALDVRSKPLYSNRRNGSEVQSVSQDSDKSSTVHKHSTEVDPSASVTVAIALGITSALMDPDMNADDMVKKFPTFTQLLPSFCHTVSCGYCYKFYFAYDVDDAFFVQEHQRNMFIEVFKKEVGRRCPSGLMVEIRMVHCYHKRRPAWAQNDAAYAAYIEGTDYTYRVNDDSWMDSENWTEIFIHTLRRMNPPNVGVVGPDHTGGAINILTYDFTHRSHIEIFGVQYPRMFTDWSGDSWITFVYKPGRLAKLIDVRLQHSMSLGRRYDYHSKAKDLPEIVRTSKDILNRYLTAKENLQQHPDTRRDPTRVISMSLFGDNYNYTNGAIRNAQLQDIFYPSWTLRIYIPHPWFSPAHLKVPAAYIHQLLKLGAEIVYVNTTELGISLQHMNLLVVLDPSVQRFLIRNPMQRFSSRESELVEVWTKSNQNFMNIRDHVLQEFTSITPDLYGAVRAWFAERLGRDIVDLLRTVKKQNDMNVRASIEDTFWEKVVYDTLYFDSVSCDFSIKHEYFKARTNASNYFIGEKFDGFGVISYIEAHNTLISC